MKKIFFALAVVAALAACSKSEATYEQDLEINFAPVAANRTKAMLSGTTFPDEQFNVFAWYKPIEAGSDIATWQASNTYQQYYIQEKPFVQKKNDGGTSTGLWGGVHAYYWPKVGSLIFAGYYPTSIEGKVEYTFTNTVNKMTISDYTPTPNMVANGSSNHTEDLMYFNMTPTSYGSNSQSTVGKVGNNVDVVFRHALSWLNVVLTKGINTPDNATIIVNSVKFTSILPTGDAVVNNSPVASIGETDEIVWTAEGTKADVEVCPDDNSETTDEQENQVTIVKNNTTPLDKQPILIPQTMYGKNLVVNYTIKSTDGMSFTEEKTIPLTTGSDSWKPAKKYTYTITISTTEILVDPKVTDWTPENIAVPI